MKIRRFNQRSSTVNEKEKNKVTIIVAVISTVGVILAAIISVVPQILPEPTSTLIVVSPTIESTNITNPNPTVTETFVPFTSPEITDNQGVQMVYVPAGVFNMGSSDGFSNEQPVNEIDLKAYYIDKYEVTNAQYKVCVSLNACKPLDTTLYYDNVKYADHPVTFVDWHKAVDFCLWREARLPTEAEWEKAARGVEELNFPWGNSIDCSYANYRGANGWCVGDSTIVGSYENGKSVYGVYDLIGNAMEWVSSVYADYPYNANDGREGLNVSNVRVIRGGSWNNKHDDIRITTRAWGTPSKAEFDLGFRCAKDAQ